MAGDRTALFEAGSFVDVLDSSQLWRVAVIQEVEPTRGVFVRYDGWGEKWNEWISTKSHRLAPFRKYSRRYTGKDNLALRDWTYDEQIAQNYRLILKAAKQGDLSAFTSPYEITQFFTGKLFTFIDSLLSWSPSTDSELRTSSALLEEFLSFSLQWMSDLPLRYAFIYQSLSNSDLALTSKDVAYACIWPEVFLTVERVLGCEQRLLTYIHTDVPLAEETMNGSPVRTRSLIHIYSIMFLIKGEGLSKVLQLVRNREEPIPIELIPHLPIWQLFKELKFDSAWLQTYVALASTALQRLCHFSETDIRYYDKDTIQRIEDNVKMIAREANCPELIAKAEEGELQVAEQLLRSKLLDKRVKGINNVCEAVLRATVERGDCFEYFNGERLAEWVNKQRLVDIIVSDRPHFEVLKRSLHLFSFLSEYQFLTVDDLDSLWRSTVDKHESYTRVVYDLVASLADFLPRSLLLSIYHYLKSVPAYTDFLISSMKKFTLNAVSSLRRARKPNNPFFLSDFLTVLTSTPAISQTIIDCMSTAIVELLSYDVMRPFQRDVLRRLLDEEAYKRAGTLPLGVVLMLMRRSTELQVRDMLGRYGKDEAQQVVGRTLKWATERASKPLNVDDLKVILEFLSVISSKGVHVVAIHEQEMMLLWEAFTAPACLPENSEIFFIWLSVCVANKNAFLVEETLRRIFHLFSRLPSASISRLQIECFRCFQQLFFRTNYLHQYLTFCEDYVITRLSPSLIGLETLVTFAVYSQNEYIRRLAIKLISQLHLRLHCSLKEDVVSVFVREQINALEDGNSAKAISGTLSILVGMIEAYETITIAKIGISQFKDWETVYYRIGADPTYKPVTLPRSEKMSSLRKAIAYFNSFTPETVILEHGSTSYSFLDDDKQLSTLGHALFFTVKIGSDRYRIVNIADVIGNDSKAVKRLFEVLETREFREQCWFILSRLTESEGIKAKIRALGADYTELMDTNSIHKQLFALRVLQQLSQDHEFSRYYTETRPNELLTTVIARFLSVDEDFVKDFEQFEEALGAQFADVLLRLMQKFVSKGETGVGISLGVISKCVCDLLFIYAKNSDIESDQSNYSLPNCVFALLIALSKRCEDYQEIHQAIGSYRNLRGLIAAALIKGKNPFFATCMSKFLTQLADSPFLLTEEIRDNVMSLLGEAVNEPEASVEFFALASKLLRKNPSLSIEVHFTALFAFLQTRAPEDSYKSQDRGLTGALKVMKTLVKIEPKFSTQRVAEHVLFVCLIDFNETQATQRFLPKCKSSESRLCAFKLLSALAQQNSTVCSFVLSALSPFFSNLSWRKPKAIHWVSSYSPLEKSSTGYVGLKNLGCTCYMNSLLQQLFTISTFRNALFQCDFQETPDSVSYQVQKIATGLWTSDKMFIQTRGLCQAYKNWEGQPINPHEQMDVDEFFNGLMDKLEAGLKDTVHPKLVDEHFRGILTTQCLGQGLCTHRSERDEPFLTLPIEIKNKTSILQSLQSLITGEVLEGDNAYACDFCNQKVTASRRLCLRSLPNVLLLTLRRFDFDMDTMTRVKLNSYCEFPLELDMEPYTVEGVMRQDGKEDGEEKEERGGKEYYQYRLRGVIIHVGSAEAGHYYSYVRTEEKEWVEFNDTSVDTFDPSNIPHEAFGTSPRLLGDVSKEEIGRMKNAYVLIYERSSRFSVKGKDDLIPASLPLTKHPTSPCAQRLFAHYEKSNQKYWKIKRVFSPEFASFVGKLISRPTSEAVKFCLSYFLTIQIRSKERTVELLEKLFDTVPMYPELSWWLLEIISFEPILRELVVTCPITEVKKCIIGLAEKCFRAVPSNLQDDFVARLVSVLPKFPGKVTRDEASYFELLHRVGLANSESLLKAQVPLRILYSVKGQECPIPPPTPLLPQSPDIDLGRKGEILEEKYAQGENALSYTSFHIAIVDAVVEQLREEEVKLLHDDKEIIPALVKGAQGRFGANQSSRLFGKFIEHNPPSDDFVFQTILHSLISELRVNEAELFRSPLLQLKRIVMIQDEYQKDRVAIVMQELVQVMIEHLTYIRVTETMVVFLHKLAQRVKLVRSWLQEKSAKLDPLSVWKQRYATWSQQSPNSLQITKTFSVLNQFTEFHPNPTISTKAMTLMNSKIPERLSGNDSDDDCYEANLLPGSRFDLLGKDDSKFHMQILHIFGPAFYLKYEEYATPQLLFVASDDDRLVYPETKFFSK